MVAEGQLEVVEIAGKGCLFFLNSYLDGVFVVNI